MIGRRSVLGALTAVMALACGFFGMAVVTQAQETGLSSLSGYVYVDQDWDGVRDPLVEWVLPDIEVLLTGVGGSDVAISTRTGQDGSYEFADLDSGTYQVTQAAIPGGYLTAKVGVGDLFDLATGRPSTAYPGDVVQYDQMNGIMPAIADIELPDVATGGIDYSFGQICTGKGWFLADPGPGTCPGGVPPIGVPEPATAALALIAAMVLAARRQWG
jgi:hypothetical protein